MDRKRLDPWCGRFSTRETQKVARCSTPSSNERRATNRAIVFLIQDECTQPPTSQGIGFE